MNILTSELPESAWNLACAHTDELTRLLARLGLEADPDAVRRAAIRAGSPSALAGHWWTIVESTGDEPPNGDPTEERMTASGMVAMLNEIALELWRRWMSDLSCAEILADEFDREYEPLDTLMFGPPYAVTEAIHRAWRVINACAPPGRGPDRDLFEEIWSHCWHDLALWLRCLPQILAHRGCFEEAIELCGRLAPLYAARAFLADRAVLLARAGRADEAAAQVMANVRAWPRDPEVLRKSCETLWSLGRVEEAMLLYDDILKALEGPVRLPDAGNGDPLAAPSTTLRHVTAILPA